jgi:NAD(P)-dependent dehydrogenase (short-subunit alcohol dehydrogenase family)
MAYQERLRLDGEQAFVTGGGRAIELCFCEAMAEAGAKVVDIERNKSDASESLALRHKGYDIDFLIGDVTRACR